MGELYQLPPGKDHKWEAWWTGKRYTTLPNGLPCSSAEPKKTRITVVADTAYIARKRASLEIGMPPEFIDLRLIEKEKDDGEAKQDLPDDRMGDGVRSRPRKRPKARGAKARKGK